jgi:hypothetical protein
LQTSGVGGLTKQNCNAFPASGVVFSFVAEIPISGLLTPAPAPPPVTHPHSKKRNIAMATLRRSSRGAAVEILQTRLNAAGIKLELDATSGR